MTSSFAGTGGIVEAMVECLVACSGALFGGDCLRVGEVGTEDAAWAIRAYVATGVEVARC